MPQHWTIQKRNIGINFIKWGRFRPANENPPPLVVNSVIISICYRRPTLGVLPGLLHFPYSISMGNFLPSPSNVRSVHIVSTPCTSSSILSLVWHTFSWHVPPDCKCRCKQDKEMEFNAIQKYKITIIDDIKALGQSSSPNCKVQEDFIKYFHHLGQVCWTCQKIWELVWKVYANSCRHSRRVFYIWGQHHQLVHPGPVQQQEITLSSAAAENGFLFSGGFFR